MLKLGVIQDDLENVLKHLHRDLAGVDLRPSFAIEVEQVPRFLLVETDPVPDGILVGIVEPPALDGSLADSRDQFLAIGAGEMEELQDVDMFLEKPGLFHTPRHPIENQDVDVRLEHVQGGAGVDLLPKKPHGQFVGHEIASAAVFDELLPDLGSRIHGAKGVSHGEMIKPRDRSEYRALSPLTGAGSPQKNEGFVSPAVLVHGKKTPIKIQLSYFQQSITLPVPNAGLTMLFSPFIALRYLKPKRTFVSIITVISILGVCLGVWLLTVVIAVFSGYGEKIKENILGFEPHLEIRAGGYIDDFVPFLEKLDRIEGVTWRTPFVWGNIIMDYQGMRLAPVIRAIVPPDPESEPEEYGRLQAKIAMRDNPAYDPETAPDEPEQVPAGKFHLDPYTAVVGDAMAESMGIDVGSKLLLYSPKDVNSIMAALDDIKSDDENTRKAAVADVEKLTVPQEVTVSGLFDSGNYEVDANLIFLHLETGQILYNFDLEESHGIAIRTDDAFKAADYKDRLLVELGLGSLQTVDIPVFRTAATHVLRSPLFLGTLAFLVLAAAGIALGFKSRKPWGWYFALVGIAALVLAFFCWRVFSEINDGRTFVIQTGGEPYQLLTWMKIHKLIFDAIATERQAMYLILFIIMIVSGFCIMNTMITVTFQKRSEIGLMKALGARESQIAWLFLFQGMFVAFIGVIAGLGLAQLTIWQRNNIASAIGNAFGVDLFSEEIYKVDGGLPAVQTWADLTIISIGAFIACTLAALIPALIAANLQPAKALRSE